MKQLPSARPSLLAIIWKLGRPLRIYLKEQQPTAEKDEAFVKVLIDVGMSEARARVFLPVVKSTQIINHDRIESYRSDRLYVGGIIALDLIMLQVLASMSSIDMPIRIAWIAFVISLPCAGGFLYVGHIEEKNKNYGYGPLHAKLAFFGVIGGGIALAAVVWHFWFVASFVLIIVMFVIFAISILYRLFADNGFLKALWEVMEELKNEEELSHSTNGQ